MDFIFQGGTVQYETKNRQQQHIYFTLWFAQRDCQTMPSSYRARHISCLRVFTSKQMLRGMMSWKKCQWLLETERIPNTSKEIGTWLPLEGIMQWILNTSKEIGTWLLLKRGLCSQRGLCKFMVEWKEKAHLKMTSVQCTLFFLCKKKILPSSLIIIL